MVSRRPATSRDTSTLFDELPDRCGHVGAPSADQVPGLRQWQSALEHQTGPVFLFRCVPTIGLVFQSSQQLEIATVGRDLRFRAGPMAEQGLVRNLHKRPACSWLAAGTWATGRRF